MFAFDDECTAYFFHGDALLAVPSRRQTRFSAYKLLSQGDERVLPGKISARYTDNQRTHYLGRNPICATEKTNTGHVVSKRMPLVCE